MIIKSSPLQADHGKIARWMTNLFIVLLTSIKCSKQGVTSDHELMSVCPGGQLMLSCSTNSSSLQWTVTVFPPSYLNSRESGVRSFFRTGQEIVHAQPIVINQTVFHFSKTSSSPLTSVVSVVNVTTDINQTRIECIHSGGMSETIIHVIRSDAIANPWPISITDEQFGANNVTITLKWIQTEVAFSSVLPAADVRLIGNTSVQLTIPYNILHNVRVAVCGQSPTKVAELYYITCVAPISSSSVINYTPPALEGSNITIECFIDDPRTNLTTDRRTLTCIDGRWEPDLDQILTECQGELPSTPARPSFCEDPMDVLNKNYLMSMDYTAPAIEGSNIDINVTCSLSLTLNSVITCMNGNWKPSPSQILERCKASICTAAASDHSRLIATIISMTVAIIVTFIIGVVCGCFCHKYKQSILASCKIPTVQSSTEKQAQQDSHDLKMTENVAYGPLRGITASNK